MLLRIGSWIAVSSEEQADGESLDDQELRNREFIEEFSRYYPGYAGTLIQTLRVAESRSITLLSDACEAIPAYQQLLDTIKAPRHQREFDALVFQSLDRLARSPALITTLHELMLTHGIVPVPRNNLPRSLDCDTLLNDFGAGIAVAVDAHRSGSEVRELVRRNKMGMPKRLREKKLFPSLPNYGYRIEKGKGDTPDKIVDEPAEQAILRLVLLEIYADGGLSANETANELNRRQIPPPGNRPQKRKRPTMNIWRGQTIHRLIDNLPIYRGRLILNHRSETGRPYYETDGTHNPVFTEEEAERILAARELHKHERRLSVHSPFLGIVYCLPCNHPMHLYSSPKKAAHGIWRDRYRMRCRLCTRTISRKKILFAVEAAVKWLQDTDDVAEFYPVPTADDSAQKREQLQDALAKIKEERRRLIRGYTELQVIPEPDFVNLSRALSSRESVIINELERLGSAEDREQKRQRQIGRLATAKGQAEERLHQLRNETNTEVVRSWLHGFLRLYVDKVDNQNLVVETVIGAE